jgi:hypothetical protein
MRSATFPAILAVFFAFGLLGCQSCVDDSSQPSSQPTGDMVRPFGEGGVRMRPRLLQPPIGHLFIRDAGAGDE